MRKSEWSTVRWSWRERRGKAEKENKSWFPYFCCFSPYFLCFPKNPTSSIKVQLSLCHITPPFLLLFFFFHPSLSPSHCLSLGAHSFILLQLFRLDLSQWLLCAFAFSSAMIVSAVWTCTAYVGACMSPWWCYAREKWQSEILLGGGQPLVTGVGCRESASVKSWALPNNVVSNWSFYLFYWLEKH